MNDLRVEVDKYCMNTDCHDCVLKGDDWLHNFDYRGVKCLHIATANDDELWRALDRINATSTYGKVIKLTNTCETIKVKYLRDVEPISKLSVGDWIDLRAAEDVELLEGEYKMIPLGVAMELPKGYEALVLPRSSTFSKYGVILTNSMGVIDESYCGDDDEWHFLAYALRNTKIPKNERICQFRIMKHQPEVELCTVIELNNKNRGGIGSTGRL